MPSEWAKKTARETWGIFGATSSKEPLIQAIAAELDAARIEGLEMAAKIAELGRKDTLVNIVGRVIAEDIRKRIEEVKG